MNSKQRVIVVGGLLVVFLMSLTPPWKSGGYALIFAPPDEGTTIDLIRLMVQSGLVLILSAALCLAFSTDLTNGKESENAATKQKGDGASKKPLIYVLAVFFVMTGSLLGWHFYSLYEDEISQRASRQTTLNAARVQQVERVNEDAKFLERLRRLAKLKEWPTTQTTVPGVRATFYTQLKNEQMYYRLQLSGRGEDLEIASQRNRSYTVSLKDADGLEVTHFDFGSSVLKPYMNGAGNWNQLTSDNQATSCNIDQYERIIKWELLSN